MLAGSQEVCRAGERLVALPEKALWWPRLETLFVADVHLGKAAAFRSSAIPVPSGTTLNMLLALSLVLAKTQARHLVLLGDLWHAKAGRTPDTVGKFLSWRQGYPDVRMTLVEGNHDRRSGPLPDGADVEEVAEPWSLGPFSLRHYPEPSEAGYVLSGHLHPAAVLEGRGGESLRLPCFWFGEEVAVLPAFGEFTGLANIRPKAGDDVFVVAENQVFGVGT